MKYQELPTLEIDGSRPSNKRDIFEIVRSKVFIVASAFVVGAFTLLVLAGGSTSSSELMSASDNICKNPDYSKTTLKTAYEGSFIALMKDTKHQKKFEASDVIRVDDYFYAICDNSWAIERITDHLTPYSSNNVQVGDPEREKDDSGYEAIFHDDASGIFYVVRESVEMKGPNKENEFHALVLALIHDVLVLLINVNCRSRRFVSLVMTMMCCALARLNSNLLVRPRVSKELWD
jgi:hypothetical protein